MAWTVSESIDKIVNTKLLGGESMYRVKVACTADANAADHILSDATMDLIKGGYIYLIKTIPGSGGDAPGAAYTLDIEDTENSHLVDLDARSTSATEFEPGSTTIGVFPIIMGTLTLSFNDQIGNGNKTTVYIYVAR